jgi:hypothetical protein
VPFICSVSRSIFMRISWKNYLVHSLMLCVQPMVITLLREGLYIMNFFIVICNFFHLLRLVWNVSSFFVMKFKRPEFLVSL